MFMPMHAKAQLRLRQAELHSKQHLLNLHAGLAIVPQQQKAEEERTQLQPEACCPVREFNQPARFAVTDAICSCKRF